MKMKNGAFATTWNLQVFFILDKVLIIVFLFLSL